MPFERFISLPQELQEQIYYHVLINDPSCLAAPIGSSNRLFFDWSLSSQGAVPIMRTTRCVRERVMYQLFKHFDMSVTSIEDLQHIPKEYKGLVKRVWLRCDVKNALPQSAREFGMWCGNDIARRSTEWRIGTNTAHGVLQRAVSLHPWSLPSLDEASLVITLTFHNRFTFSRLAPRAITSSFVNLLSVLDLQTMVLGLKDGDAKLQKVLTPRKSKEGKSIYVNRETCPPSLDLELLQSQIWKRYHIETIYDKGVKTLFVGKGFGTFHQNVPGNVHEPMRTDSFLVTGSRCGRASFRPSMPYTSDHRPEAAMRVFSSH